MSTDHSYAFLLDRREESKDYDTLPALYNITPLEPRIVSYTGGYATPSDLAQLGVIHDGTSVIVLHVIHRHGVDFFSIYPVDDVTQYLYRLTTKYIATMKRLYE